MSHRQTPWPWFLTFDFHHLHIKLPCHAPFLGIFWSLFDHSFPRYSHLKTGYCPKSWLGTPMPYKRTYKDNFTSTLLSEFWDNLMNDTSFYSSHRVVSRYVFRLGLSWKLRNFKNCCHFGGGAKFLPGSSSGIWRCNQDSHGHALCSALMIGFLAQILTKLRRLKILTHF